MKNILKRLLPYVIINGIVYAIIGAIIGKNYMEIRNTRRKIQNDEDAIKRFMGDMAKICPNKMSINELEGEDDRKPIEPTPIYIYD